VKYWCLGNEMDGPWQIGQLTAREYGRKARDIAQQARVIDPDVQLIACGSSAPGMPNYLQWDREVLEECYDMVDGISLHCYYGNGDTSGGKTERFLAMNIDMERQIQEIAAVCDYVQGLKRASKKLWLSFDEWNVWYRANQGDHTNGHGKFAPKLLEEVYNLEDALLVGGLLNTLLRRSDRVRVACLAQIVNVIAPLMTSDKGILRQSTYYPYAMALQYARGRVLDLQVQGETYPIRAAEARGSYARDAQVPFVDVVGTYDKAAGRIAVFALNRDLTAERELSLAFDDVVPTGVVAAETLTGTDLKAFNTFEQPDKVVPAKLDGITAGSKMTLKLPPRSYTVVQLSV
jgi:alpha-N-arabinofuranosidase